MAPRKPTTSRPAAIQSPRQPAHESVQPDSTFTTIHEFPTPVSEIYPLNVLTPTFLLFQTSPTEITIKSLPNGSISKTNTGSEIVDSILLSSSKLAHKPQLRKSGPKLPKSEFYFLVILTRDNKLKVYRIPQAPAQPKLIKEKKLAPDGQTQPSYFGIDAISGGVVLVGDTIITLVSLSETVIRIKTKSLGEFSLGNFRIFSFCVSEWRNRLLLYLCSGDQYKFLLMALTPDSAIAQSELVEFRFGAQGAMRDREDFLNIGIIGPPEDPKLAFAYCPEAADGCKVLLQVFRRDRKAESVKRKAVFELETDSEVKCDDSMVCSFHKGRPLLWGADSIVSLDLSAKPVKTNKLCFCDITIQDSGKKKIEAEWAEIMEDEQILIRNRELIGTMKADFFFKNKAEKVAAPKVKQVKKSLEVASPKKKGSLVERTVKKVEDEKSKKAEVNGVKVDPGRKGIKEVVKGKKDLVKEIHRAMVELKEKTNQLEKMVKELE